MPSELNWRLRPYDALAASALASEFGIPPAVARVLAGRNLGEPGAALAFLNDATLPPPAILSSLTLAVERIRAAVTAGERITVYGDYDADGVTATAVLVRALQRFVAKTAPRGGTIIAHYIPNRLDEGYGLNVDAIRTIAAAGTDLLVTVDCGISAVDEVAAARELGMDVIITDHHTPPAELPAALALLNPHLPDVTALGEDLAGVGVAWRLAEALLGGDAADYLDLVSAGTVADVVPLLDANRRLVRGGIARLAQRGNPGLRALARAAGVDPDRLSADRIAFALAPRLNAAGRLGDSATAVRLLLTDDAREAEHLAAQLDDLNKRRQALEQKTRAEALAMAAAEVDMTRDRIIVLAGDGWHHGIIGIVAAKVSEAYGLPTILLCREPNGVARGSGRSTPEFNLIDALTACDDVFDRAGLGRYGGHAAAAGLTLAADRVPLLRERLNALAWKAYGPEEGLPPAELLIDAELQPTEVNLELTAALAKLEPFGEANPQPLFICRGLTVADCALMGKDRTHLRLRFGSGHEAIGFGFGARERECQKDTRLDIAFVPERDSWNGVERLRLRLVDLLPSGSARAGALIDLTGDNLALALAARAEAGGGTVSKQVAEAEAAATLVDELFAQAAELLVDDFYRNIAARRQFFTKVAGVSFEGRQQWVAACAAGDRLQLRREPTNAYDPNAVAVHRDDGRQVGFLNKDLARNLAPLLDAGAGYDVTVTQRTGGETEADGKQRSYGLNILLERQEQVAAGGDPTALAARLRAELARLTPAERDERIRRALLGEHDYRPKQAEAIAAVEAGANALVIMGTGRGKSVIFQTIAARRALAPAGGRKLTIIVYPLRALANDQFEKMRLRLGALGVRVLKVNGSLGVAERERAVAALANDGVDVILTTPEYIECHLPEFQAIREQIALFVVDESHHVATSSLAHRPAYRRLGQVLADLGWPQRLAVTATAGDTTAADVQAALRLDALIIDPHVRENLRLVDSRNRQDRDEMVTELARKGEKTIIYVNSRTEATRLATELRRRIPELRDEILFYHAGLSDSQRQAVERFFASGLLKCVVSTSAFGEGVDVSDIRHVVHYHLTFNETEFNQESGRAGRDDRPASIHLLYGERDVRLNEFVLDLTGPERDVLGELYRQVRSLAVKQSDRTITTDNATLAELVRNSGCDRVGDNTVSAGLGILEELGLVERTTDGRQRLITVPPGPATKLDLNDSVRYREARVEKEAFRAFSVYALTAPPEDLLTDINRPLYPTGPIKEEAK